MLRWRRWIFPVFCQASAAPEPCEGAFDDPSSGEDFEALGGVGALDDLEGPLADPVEGAAQFRPGISAIGEQMAQPGACPREGGEQAWRMDFSTAGAPSRS